LTSAPGAVSWGFNRLDVFVRGTNGAVYQKSWIGDRWDSWYSLGGSVTGPPAVASQGSNQLEFFVRDGAGYLNQRSWRPSQWTGWLPLGIVMY
jgi:hypothetical protein